MRWLFRAIAALVTLAVAAVVALLLIPAERIAQFAADRFEAATGRAVTFTGEVRPSLWPELGISTGAVTLANADWAGDAPMFAAESLAIGVDPQALFGGAIRIRRIEARAPRIRLERAADGRGNWAFAGAGERAPSGEASSRGLPVITLDRAELSDAALRFVDRATGTEIDLTDISATLALPDAEGPADLDLSGRMNGQPLRLSGQVGALVSLLDGSAVPVTAEVEAAGSRAAFDGRAALEPVAATGRVSAEIADLAALLSMAGRTPPELPGGTGRGITASGEITYTEGTLNLRSGRLAQGANSLVLSADVALAERPRVVARVSAGALDLSAFRQDGGEAETAESADGWPRDRIDVSGLQALDGELLFNAASVDLGSGRLGRVETRTTLDAGRAVTEIRQLAAYEGGVRGSFVVNSRGGLSVRANLAGSGLALEPLLTDFADFDRLGTTGDLTVNLLGVGNSVHDIMHSLSGDGSVSLGAGELRGLDLVGMIRNLDPSYVGEGARTIFDSVSASFVVNEGVLINEDLAVDAPLFTAEGEGVVALGPRELNYTVTPALLEGQQVRVPVRITGPWSKPRFGLDLEKATEGRIGEELEGLRQQAEERLQEEVDRATGEAAERVRERIGEELGIEPGADSTIDDVIRGLLGNGE